jgi:hypothetical protein
MPDLAGGTELTGLHAVGDALVERILLLGIEGAGPLNSARAVAEESLAATQDRERAVARVIARHWRIVGVSGFVTGFGGLPSMAVTVPADVVSFYALSARMAAAIAHLRGHDTGADYVQSVVLVSLLGTGGTAALNEAGVQVGNRAALAALHRLPASTLTRINQKVGYRLVTRFGEKGVINLVKIVPVLGGGIGAGVNMTGITAIAKYAKRNFPAS